jgi:hypothetical protein
MNFFTLNNNVARWWCHGWFRQCATSRKVAGSIPGVIIGILHWHNSSGRTVALGLKQPLTEMSTRSICWGSRRPVCRAENLTTYVCRLSWNLKTSDFRNPRCLSRPVMGFFLHLLNNNNHNTLWILFSVALRPNVRHGLLILEVSRSHTTTHHSR